MQHYTLFKHKATNIFEIRQIELAFSTTNIGEQLIAHF